MSDCIGHECGLVLLRLRRPLDHYREKYGDWAWGLRRLYLLMEKQHNRGQDGAGVGLVKFDMPPGEKFMLRVRSDRSNAIERIFDTLTKDVNRLAAKDDDPESPTEAKRRCEFVGEVYLGHLRYGTHAGNARSFCHPLQRKNNVASRNLAVAGNFNMTNSRQLFEQLLDFGLNPVGESDTQVVLERLGWCLDGEHEQLTHSMGPDSLMGLDGRELAEAVSRELDLRRVLERASSHWDGGYVFAGLLGNGDAFACRDPSGIRPAFFHLDEEVVAVASERAALAAVFNREPEEIEPLRPGHVLTMKHDGDVRHERFTPERPVRQCTFERIYFSRGNDPDIYRERKALGRALAPRILDLLGPEADRAVFSFVPNTAETAYLGLVEAVEEVKGHRLVEEVWERLQQGTASKDDLEALAGLHVRTEKVAHKDQRMRTFIAHDKARRDLVMHIYDITRGIVGHDEALVVVDDSIVRGTTLRESIIKILSRLDPARIVIASSAPPIMYPDCYGIDMSQLGRFIAFEAATSLIEERGLGHVFEEVELACRAMLDEDLPDEELQNPVQRIYEPFTLDELSARIADLVRPKDLTWDGPVDVLYQTVDALQAAMPEHTGDWYFTGEYPTPGGYRVVCRSFLNWRSRVDVRAY